MEQNYCLKDSARKLKRRNETLAEMLNGALLSKRQCQHQLLQAEQSVREAEARAKAAEERAKTAEERAQVAEATVSASEATLSGLFEELTSQLYTQHLVDQLEKFKSLPLALFARDAKSYSDEARQFALTLFSCSPKAYEFVRTKLPLPASRTLRRWLSSIDGRPGCFVETANLLREKVKENPYLFGQCALMIDGMSIRKFISWDSRTHSEVGYVNMGFGPDPARGVATEDLVFHCVSLCGKLEIPVGYVLINKVNGTELSELILRFIGHIHSTGVKVRALVMDALPANVPACQLLGCHLSPKNLSLLKTHFTIDENDVYVFLDVCHALKLLRNTLGARELISNRGRISWRHIVRVYEAQRQEGLHLATKLTSKHIAFQDHKMKTCLAAQTFSNSVFCALSYLRLHPQPGQIAVDSRATEKLLQLANDSFDILNSRGTRHRGSKAPLRPGNAAEKLAKLDEFVQYLSRLKLVNPKTNRPELLFHSKRHQAAFGFVVAQNSLKNLYGRYLNSYAFFLTYRLSQDHIELLFNSIRRRGGWNNNPSAQQLCGTFRSILLGAGCHSANAGNSLPLDDTPPPAVISAEDVIELNITNDQLQLTEYVEDVVQYIGGWVVRKASSRLHCVTCTECLET